MNELDGLLSEPVLSAERVERIRRRGQWVLAHPDHDRARAAEIVVVVGFSVAMLLWAMAAVIVPAAWRHAGAGRAFSGSEVPMVGMFAAGGVMLPVLVVGVLAVAAGVRHASGPGAGWARAGSTLRSSTLALAAAGVALDLAAASSVAAGVEDGTGVRIWMQALSPLILGGLLAALGALFSAVGDVPHRRSRADDGLHDARRVRAGERTSARCGP